MSPGSLITQCLQNDFVRPIGAQESLPNSLHIGHAEARRLCGELPERPGALFPFMDWALSRSAEELRLIHIRDWHDHEDPDQAEHLERFGSHCLAGSEGAGFVFQHLIPADRKDPVVNATGLNDFAQTNLPDHIYPLLEEFSDPNEPIRIGLIGVWTEAKINYLCYDLRTRFPDVEIGICSALCASSSRQNHFLALDQMRDLLGARIFSSWTDFAHFLTGGGVEDWTRKRHSRLEKGPGELVWESESPDNKPPEISDDKRTILHWLFRENRQVSLKILDGGYSGNLVAAACSVDRFGHREVPSVLKIGERESISREKDSFERVQEVLGNHAPHIIDYVETGPAAGIRYRYAAMSGSGGNTRSLQELIMDTTVNVEEVERVLRSVFGEQLGRLYQAARLEKIDLWEYYDFQPRYGPSLRARAEQILGQELPTDTPVWETDVFEQPIPNLEYFYAEVAPQIRRSSRPQAWMSFVHGDLNGANILRDATGNVWLIDFFHTHYGHILKDLIKLENDLLYIFAPMETRADIQGGRALVCYLADWPDLGRELPADPPDFLSPGWNRIWRILVLLRSFYPGLIHSDRASEQYLIGALRYAAHTLSFDECDLPRKQMALWACGQHARRLTELAGLRDREFLRVDFLPARFGLAGAGTGGGGRLGLTILPGRLDRKRDLARDLSDLVKQGVGRVLCLVTRPELEYYGVNNLLSSMEMAGLDVFHVPIPDGSVCSVPQMDEILAWLRRPRNHAGGPHTLIHCVGGLGRSGLVAACWLKSRHNLGSGGAMKVVRDSRSPRAIETRVQEDFIRDYEN